MNNAAFEMIRDRYRVLCEHKQPGKIIHLITESVGLTDANGKRHLNASTRDYTLAQKRSDGSPIKSASEFRLDVLAEAIIGRDWKEHLGFDRDTGTIAIPRLLREESAAPIGPSVFSNVAAWAASVGGLMQAQFIEGWQQAQFDLPDFPTRQAIFWQGGERMPTIFGPTEPAPEVGIGAEHPDMSMSAMWIEPGAMKKYGGKVLVTKETGVVDISGGQILQKAKEGGQSLKFRENELKLDIICGQTNNFKLGFRDDSSATGYNTYGATIVSPQSVSRTVPNDNVNPLNDVAAFTNSDLYQSNLYHPLTDNPIDVQMNTVLLPTPLAQWGRWLLGTEQLTAMTQTTAAMAQAAPGTFPNFALTGKNPWQGTLTPFVSKWLHQRHTASTTAPSPNRTAGLGLTGAGVYRWYRLDVNQFAARRVAWEPTSIDLSPNDYIMAVQGIVSGQVFNVAVQYQVMNPFAIQLNKGA